MSYLAEQNIIGALLMDPSVIREIYGDLKPEMFRTEFLGEAYLEFLRAYDNNQKMDVVLLCEKMSGHSYPDSMVRETIRECISSTVTSANIRLYAKVVADEYKAAELSRLLNQSKPSPNEINTQIGGLITALEALKGGDKVQGKSLDQIVVENRDKYFCEKEKEGIYTGFPKLDDTLGRLEGGDVVVIGARPAVGKSAFITQVALNFTRKGKRVGFYNLEMQEKQMYERFVSGHSGISLTRLRRAKQFLGDERDRFQAANEYLRGQDIIINTGGRTVGQIRNESRHMEYDVLIIDYLQLLRSDVRYQNRTSEVGAVSKALKNLAMELNIPIIALSQLNRVSEMKEDKEPTMAELREAGDIEQDASIIILMWNLSEDRIKKGLKVDKNRQGELRKMVLKFSGDFMKFEETDETVKQASGWKEAEEGTPFD